MNGRMQLAVGAILAAIGYGSWTFELPYLSQALSQIPGLAQEWTDPDAASGGFILAGLVFALTGVVTMIATRLAGMLNRGRDEAAERQQLDLFHELLTGAAVRMVGADGVVAPSEVAMLQGVLERFGQQPVNEKTIRSIAEASAKDPDHYLGRIHRQADELTEEQRTHILRACLLVGMADVVLDAAEVEYLQKVSEALKLPQEKIDAVRAELTNVASKLVGAAAFAA